MFRKFTHIFAPPVFPEDEEKTRSASLLNVIVLVSLAALVFVFFFLPAERLPYAALAVLIFLSVWYMMRAGRIRLASIMMVGGIGLVLGMATITGGGVRATSLGAFTVLIIFTGLLLGGRAAYIVSGFSVLYATLLYQAELLGWIDTYEPVLVSYWGINSVYFILTGIMLFLALQMMGEAMRRAKLENEERRQAELDLRRRDAMLEAVTYSAEQFLGTSDWHDVIAEVLERLGMITHATHAYLFEDHTGPGGEPLTSMRYEWTAPGFPDDLERQMYQNSPVHQAGFEEQVQDLSRGNVRMGTSATFNPIEKQLMDEAGVRSILEVPVFVNGREWGAIGFDDFETEREWSPAEVDALKIAGNVLGTAIKRQLDETALQKELAERAALIEDLRIGNAESETLRDSLASLVGSLDFSEIIETILDQIRRVVPYDSASIWTIVGRTQVYIAGRNVPPEITVAGYGIEISPENSAVPILSGDVPYILNLDVQSQLKDFQVEPHTYVQSWLAIPLKRRGQVVGLIALDGRRKDQFTQHHAELAVTFANQVSIAVENSRLFSELQNELVERRLVEVSLRQRESLLEALSESANRFLKAPDWRTEISFVLERLGLSINASHAYLFEKHMHDDGVLLSSMRYEWVAPGQQSDLDNPDYQNSPVREAGLERYYATLDQGEPFVGSSSYFSVSEMDLINPSGIRALLEMRIVVNGAQWGTIGFDEMTRDREWTPLEVDVVRASASVLGAAIKRQMDEAALEGELNLRRLLIDELESKNTELERFTYTVSHDLKSPLFTIRGFLGYLQQDALSGDVDRLTNDIQRITDAAEKMQLLLNDLLELSRIGRVMNDPQTIHFGRLIEEVLELLHGQIHARGVRVTVQEALPAVFGDRQRLLEVVQNLVENAVKFLGDRPDPCIEIGQRGGEPEHGHPIFYIRDNGIGIAPEQHERIFGLFNKLDPKSEGTGIGLALVKRIIEFHRGRIWVESRPGEGTAFLFTLPTAPPE